MLFDAKLPARAGYVEVEVNGVRQYRKVETPETIRQKQTEADMLTILDLIADHEYKLCLMELEGGETTI